MTSRKHARHARKRSLTATTVLASVAIARGAAAQQVAATEGDTGGADQGTLSEVVVSSQRRDENLQNVPISIQALSADVLDQHQAVSFDDYVKLLPSVSFQAFGPGQSQLFFRGISTGADGIPNGTLPTAGVYLDELPVTQTGGVLDVHLYDIARIEALSGPQGTLFGASSLAGTLRIITNKPDPSKFSAGYDLQGDKYGDGAGGGTVEGFINLPLGSRAALRASGFYEHDGGYINNTLGSRTYQRPTSNPDGSISDHPLTVDNTAYVSKDFNPVETYGGRAALGIELNDSWTVTPSIVAQDQHTEGAFLYDPRVGDLDVHDFTPDHTADDWYQAGLVIQGKIADWELLYSGGYLSRVRDITADYSYYTVAYDHYPGYTYFQDASGHAIDPTQVFHNVQQIEKVTNEVRVSSPAHLPVRVTAGLFYQHQGNRNRADYTVPGLSNTVVNQIAVYGDDPFLTNTHVVDRDAAAYAQASWDITSRLTLTGGIRGFNYKNSLTGFSGFAFSALDAGCSVPLATADSCQSAINKNADGSGETHKLSLSWQFDPDLMAYLTYSTGFRPGGVNRSPTVNPYSADTLRNSEIGWKSAWLNHTLRIDGAAYYEKWNNVQYALGVVGLPLINIYNAGDARVYGLETNIDWIIGGLTVSLAGAYNNARLTTSFCQIGADGNPDCASGIISAPAGTRLPNQPQLKGTLTARYTFTVGRAQTFVQAGVNHQSGTRSYLGTSEDQALGDTVAFSTADFSIGGTIDNKTVSLFIQNAFDERGELSRNTECAPVTCGAYSRVYPIKPQYFGIKVGQKF